MRALTVAIAISSFGLFLVGNPAEKTSSEPARTSSPTYGSYQCIPMKPASVSSRSEKVLIGSGAQTNLSIRSVTFPDEPKLVQEYPNGPWEATKASDAELKRFGVEARPERNSYSTQDQFAIALASWQQRWSTPTQFVHDRCETVFGALRAGTRSDPAWSGMVTYAPKALKPPLGFPNAISFYNKASGYYVQPNTDLKQCGTSSTHAAWVGIGGDGRLIQVGSIESTAFGKHFFYEALSEETGASNAPQPILNPAPTPGHWS